MIARTLSKTVVFSRPLLLKGIDRTLPAGDYRVVTDEGLIDGLSFPAYRRVATMIFVPAQASSIEMVTIDPQDLQAAQDRDARHDEQTSRSGPGSFDPTQGYVKIRLSAKLALG